MNNEIKITIDDQTKDDKLTGVDLGDNSLTAGTTSKATKTGSKRFSGAKQLGMSAANTVSGGLTGKVQGAMATSMTPLAVATVALTVATTAYNRWIELEKKRREQEQVAMRAGGHYRTGDVNISNARVQFITGRIVSDNQRNSRGR